VTTLDTTETTFSELANRARALATEGARTVLGITGAPGAGKTTLAERLVREIGPEVAVLVSMDGYHLANTVLHDLNRHPRKGAWDTFDAHGYVKMIERIRAQRDHVSQGTEGTIYAPHFRRDLEEPVGSAIAVRPETPLVITEGNYLLLDVEPWAQARRVIDHIWFLAPPESQRMDQLIRRHERFGRSAEEARERSLGSDQRNAEIIMSTAARADLVVRLVD